MVALQKAMFVCLLVGGRREGREGQGREEGKNREKGMCAGVKSNV